MQAVGRPPQRAPGGAPFDYERHRPEQTTRYRLVQQHPPSFMAHAEASTGAELPRFNKDEFHALLECGILAHGFLRLHCAVAGATTPSCGPSAASVAGAVPNFVQASAPNDDELHLLLQTGIARLMKMLTRRGVLVEDMGQTYLAEPDADVDEARTPRPLQAA